MTTRKYPGVLLIHAFLALITACTFDVKGLPASNDSLPGCGNGILEEGEECDGTYVPTCAEMGLGGGVTFCTHDCKVDTTQCSPCVECTPGETRCKGDTTVLECTQSRDSTECLVWQQKRECAFDGLVCWKGECVQDCTDECTIHGEVTCSATTPNEYDICEQDGACLAWKEYRCEHGSLCQEDATPLPCTPCNEECIKGTLSCSPDYKNVTECKEDAYGCTSFAPIYECEENLFCSTFDGTCVTCASCTEGEKKCSNNGNGVLECSKITDGCNLWLIDEECPQESMETCNGGQCIQQGDTCVDAPIVNVGEHLLLDDFHHRFTDTSPRPDYCAFPSEGFENKDLPDGYGHDAFFAVQLDANQAIEIVANNPYVIVWALGQDCSTPKCAGLEQGTLLFGAPTAGKYYFGIEAPTGVNDVEIEVRPSSTVCTHFAPLDGSDGHLPGEGGIYCVRVRQGSGSHCVTVPGAPYMTIRTIGLYPDNRFSCGGDTYLWLYDQDGNEVAHNDDIPGDKTDLCSRIVASSLATQEYKVCMNSYNQMTSISPYAAIEVHPYQGLYAIARGDLAITEIWNGHGVEIKNTTNNIVSLESCRLGDDSTHKDLGNILVPPLDFVVIEWDADLSSLSNLILKCGGKEIDHVPVSALSLAPNRSIQVDTFSEDAASNDDPASWCTSELNNFRYSSDVPDEAGDLVYHSMGRHNHPCDLANHMIATFDFRNSCPPQIEWEPTEGESGTWSCGGGEGMVFDTTSETWVRYRYVPGFDFRGYNYVVAIWNGELHMDSSNDSEELVTAFNVYRPYREGPLNWNLTYGRVYRLVNRESDVFQEPIEWNPVRLGFDVSRKASRRAGVHLLFSASDTDGGVIDYNLYVKIDSLTIYAY